MHPAISLALTRIAAREGCDVVALPPLYETIDPEAVTALLESEADVTIGFEYIGYRVVLEADSLEVTALDTAG